MINPRRVGSILQSFKNVSAMKTCSFFCFVIKAFKTSFEHTFFISKFCHRNVSTLIHKISVLSVTSLIIFLGSYSISRFTFSILHVLHVVAGQPARAPSPTDSLPFQKRRFFTAVLFNTCVPHKLVSFFIISAFVLFFRTRNLITELCSVCSRSSSSYKCKMKQKKGRDHVQQNLIPDTSNNETHALDLKPICTTSRLSSSYNSRVTLK